MPERPPGDFEPGLGRIVRHDEVLRDLAARQSEIATSLEAERERRGRDRLAELADLAGGMAHEFNNVLAVILSSAGFVAESLPDDSPLAADLERIQEAAERGARLTRQFLGNPAERAVRTPVDVQALLEHVEWVVGRAGNADLQIRRRTELPPVLGDTRELEQLLLTLVLPHPDVTGRVRRVVVNAVADGGQVVLTVTAPVTARRFGDSLALATAHNLARRAGAELDVDDSDPEQLVVRLRLPATIDGPVVDLTPSADTGEPRRTILVVDDEPALLLVTARLLREAGYAVLEAAGGAEALQLVEANHVDVVLTDIVMPRLTGVELAEQLDARPDPPTVLFMSGYSDGLLEAGPGRHVPLLQKPFSRAQLLDHVAGNLPSASPRGAT